jgi:inosine/xanthosine triphosphate pyrophosphatase family protein
MTIYFITGNKSKFTEGKAILPELEQLEIDLPEIQEIDARLIIEAKEDTSLYLECLNGLPGPLIKVVSPNDRQHGACGPDRAFQEFKGY